MTNRPDIDEDVRRLLERPSDPLSFSHYLALLTEPGDRLRTLTLFATAALQAAIRADIAELRKRGIQAVPVCVGRGDTMHVSAPDRTRRVTWLFGFEKTSIDIVFYYVDRDQQLLRSSVQLPLKGTTDYGELPAQVRRSADLIRAFLLHGELPRDSE